MRKCVALAVGLSFICVAEAGNTRERTCRPALFKPLELVSESPGAVKIVSKHAEFIKDKSYTFSEEVNAAFGAHKVAAGQIIYYPESNKIFSEGNVRYQGNGLMLKSKTLTVDLTKGIISGNNNEYLVQDTNANGQAENIVYTANIITGLTGVSYSTCPAALKPDWQVKAAELKLDHASGWGEARKAKLKLKNVPVLYIPFMRFALDKRRKSGFLNPELDYGDDDGLALYSPYYFNIKPNLDLTLTPGFIAKRGLWAGGEMRYLNPRYRLKLRLEGINQDKLRNDERRYLGGIYAGDITPGDLSWNIDYTDVSDDDYIDDFMGSFLSDKRNYLIRHADIGFNRNDWHLSGRLFGVESLINDSNSYEYLPRLSFGRNRKIGNVTAGFNHQYTRFYHKDKGKTTGERFNSEVALSYPLIRPAFYLTPKLMTRSLEYRNLTDFSAAKRSKLNHTFSLDSGVFLEREFESGGTEWVQTLNPRLYYVYRDDESINTPNFDSSRYSFSLPYLFSPDLYSGKDLQGDIDRLSFGVGTDFLRPNGSRRVFNFNIAQAYDFNARGRSPVALETGLHLNKLSGSNRLYIAPHGNKTDAVYTTLNYRPNRRLQLKLSHSYRQNSYNAVSLGGLWRINNSWTVFGRNRHSLKDNEQHLLERTLGFSYNSCCWKISFNYERKLTDSSAVEYEDRFRMNLELKGLGVAGNLPDSEPVF